jgi:hypothetical protein
LEAKSKQAWRKEAKAILNRENPEKLKEIQQRVQELITTRKEKKKAAAKKAKAASR